VYRRLGEPPRKLYASGIDFPDALAASAAAAQTHAPPSPPSNDDYPTEKLRFVSGGVLLTPGSERPPYGNPGGRRSIAVGGPAAASLDAFNEFNRQFGGGSGVVSFSRIVGVDRYETAALVADELTYRLPGAATVASGVGWPDGLAAAAGFARDGAPLLLTRPDAVPDPTAAWLQQHAHTLEQVTVVGGGQAIAESTRQTLLGLP